MFKYGVFTSKGCQESGMSSRTDAEYSAANHRFGDQEDARAEVMCPDHEKNGQPLVGCDDHKKKK